MAGGADGKRDEPFVNRQFPQGCPITPGQGCHASASGLTVWRLATFLLYLGSIRLILAATPAKTGMAAEDGGQSYLPLLVAAAFPAVFVNLSHGHNGFLSGPHGCRAGDA